MVPGMLLREIGKSVCDLAQILVTMLATTSKTSISTTT